MTEGTTNGCGDKTEGTQKAGDRADEDRGRMREGQTVGEGRQAARTRPMAGGGPATG